MSLDADLLADRFRLRRRLAFWRIFATVVVIGALLTAGAMVAGSEPATSRAHIAKLQISGLITGSQKTLDLIRDIGKSQAAGVLVMIDSPGGTTSGSEAIYDALRALSGRKPTVAVVGTTGASGAYIAALATDHIVARQTALVGSIGVLFQYPNVSKLLDTVGVKVEEVKSSPLKASPNGFEPTPPEARAALASIVTDTFDWFKRLVRDRRNFNDAQLAAVSDGRVFTGHQALNLKLVDEVGGEPQAVAWLEREKGVTKGLPVREWKPKSTTGLSLWSSAEVVASLFGYDELASAFHRASLEADAARLDGLLALWQVPVEK